MTGLSSFPLSCEEDQARRFKGAARILGPRRVHLPIVTIGLLGVQIFWSVEMSYASPYLLSLGLSKSSMAIVFVAGPLSGLVMQPLIGFLADNSTSPFGRRRPYMLLGTIICIFAMLLLGFTRAVASIFTGWNNSANDYLTMWLAVFSIYLIDFSINAVQAVDRALLVDTLPPSSQASGNAWAARMLGFGSVVGFFVGNVDLPAILPFLGRTQLQVLSVVVSLLLLAGHLVMAILVKERVLLKDTSAVGTSKWSSFSQELKDMWSNIRTLPRVIRQICFIQFFAWIAWFPILFYSTIYIGDLHKRTSPTATNVEEQASIDAEATRLGSRALFYSAVLALFVNVVLPVFVSESAKSPNIGLEDENTWWERVCRVPKPLQIHLATIWAISHFVFAACMFATFFTQSVFGSTLIITVTGFSWAITQWAPFSLLAEAILTEPAPHSSETVTAIRLADARTPLPRSSEEQEREMFLSGRDSDEEDEDGDEGLKRLGGDRMFDHPFAPLSTIDEGQINGDRYAPVTEQREDERRETSRGEGETLSSKAGIILGIHNIFIVIPQFLVTGFSAVLFALIDPQKPIVPGHRVPTAPHPGPATNVTVVMKNVTEMIVRTSSEYMQTKRAEAADASHSNSVVYIFRVGGIAASVAFVLCWRLAKEFRHR